MIRVFLVDDEPLAREGLRALLREERDLEMLGEAEDGLSAVSGIIATKPDLVCLDVQMPGLDGFEVLEALGRDRPPAVIFVTAYDLHALQAFQVHAVDYLLKPIDPQRLKIALDRARRLLPRDTAEGRIDELLRHLQSTRPYPERFLVRSPGALRVVPVADVLWIEADGDYARLHLAKEEHLLRETMSALEARLDPERFVRLHRSYFARIDQVRELRTEGNGDAEVTLATGTRLPVSRTYRERLVAALERAR